MVEGEISIRKFVGMLDVLPILTPDGKAKVIFLANFLEVMLRNKFKIIGEIQEEESVLSI